METFPGVWTNIKLWVVSKELHVDNVSELLLLVGRFTSKFGLKKAFLYAQKVGSDRRTEAEAPANSQVEKGF